MGLGVVALPPCPSVPRTRALCKGAGAGVLLDPAELEECLRIEAVIRARKGFGELLR
jgi:hypothetical protein